MKFLLIYVPNLRFNQFNSEWERKSIGDLINEVKEYTSSFENYPLYSFTIESGVTPKTERYERNFLVKKDGDLFKVVHPNNFVMNPMNLRFGAINYSKQTIDVSVSGYYDIFEIDNSNYNDFWNAYFKAPQTINTYNSIATGSLVEKKRVHFSQLKSLKFYLPSNDEKEKINSFIKLLDDRISVQIKIIDDYNSLKMGIYNCMFKENYADYKLKQLAYIVKGDQINNDQLLSNGSYYMMNGGASPSGYLDSYNVSENTISISEGGNSCGYVQFNSSPFWSGGHCYTIQNVNSALIENKYLYHYLKYKEKEIMNLRIGTGLPNIQKKDLENFTILVPSLLIQRKNLALFEMLDEKTSILNEELANLQKQKKYLLCNMFI